MNPLRTQTSAGHTYITYKLGREESLDRMTVGMMRNNAIPGLLPLDIARIDSDRWLKYDITDMMPMHVYFSGVMTRQKTLNLLSQVMDMFLALEDYMIDASFLILENQYAFVNAVDGKIGIICLPLSGFVGNVTLKDFVRNMTRTVQFNSRENCDYVTKLLNFSNDSSFSIENFRKLLGELKSESIQRIQRKIPEEDNMGNMGGNLLDERNGQAAVSVDSIAGMVSGSSLSGNINQSEIGVNVNEAMNPVINPSQKQKPPKEKKRLFGKKKKKQEQAAPVSAPSGMQIPGVEIPGMPVPGPIVPSAPEKENQKMNIPVDASENLSGIAEKINTPEPDMLMNNMLSNEYSKKVAISDGTIMLNAEPELPALIRRLRTGETALLENDELVIGKDRKSVDYCIEDNSTISRVHAKIIRRGSQYYIIDNHSTNHTFVNDKQIEEGKEVPIENGAKLRLSDEEFIFNM
jgi:hypothetical protein